MSLELGLFLFFPNYLFVSFSKSPSLILSLLCAAGDGEISASCGMDASWLVEPSGMHGTSSIDNTLDSMKRGPSTTNYMAMQDCSTVPWSMSESSHNCPRCGKSYQHKGSLSRHLRVECGNLRSEMCSVCLKSFLYKHHLDRHMKYVHNM